MKTFLNLVEPPGYPLLLAAHPPEGFEVLEGAGGLPLFKTSLDLLTTLEAATRRRIKKWPLFPLWSGLLQWPACFAGSPITEYAPLPVGLGPEELLDSLIEQAGSCSLAIVKDLPRDSPLLSPMENDLAQKLVEAGVRRGFFELAGQALAYVPIDFNHRDDYLGRLSASRRKDLRRKLKTAAALTIEVLEPGADFWADEAVVDEFYALYLEVFQQSDIHFDLLSRGFFQSLLRGGHPGLVVIYRHQGLTAGFNICLIHRGALIDKYIGFQYPLARQLNLYFVSWLHNLELARSRGLKVYIAGWTDPEVKAALGARFTFTRHLVWVKNPLKRALLRPLRGLFESDRRTLESL
ncbi:MAG: GNAT family N-acetyltransferase [Candidatus Adiutrix sp.]|jgi:hypothetical protein|nr:GNAT family N-acetyltransferase [Candidatus Adiutrix sp.]